MKAYEKINDVRIERLIKRVLALRQKVSSKRVVHELAVLMVIVCRARL